MCGRFINLTKSNNLNKIFNINTSKADNMLSYNISPSQNSHIIFKDKIFYLDVAIWGYSFYEKKTKQEKNIINSRLETVEEKVLFRDSYYKRKCIIPINGYYEWSFQNNNKIPFFIHVPPHELMYMAGIWKYIDFKNSKKKVFTVLTKKSNGILNKIHYRMPVILSQEESEDYLDDFNSSFLTTSFNSSIEKELDFYPVSKFVNNPINNSKECIKNLQN